jgi:peptidoglycan hydrolase-like protein with peptidoglycan-binding domain
MTKMTLFYPDVANYQGNINLAGAPAVCSKATQGNWYFSGYYTAQKAEAAVHGLFFTAYHFLEVGNGASQANFCFSKTGKTPLMLDFEEYLSNGVLHQPKMPDAVAFIDQFRALGGIVNLVYLPNWYWKKIGSPSLQPFIDRGLKLVSSFYTGYSDTGPGWVGYGGMTVACWQFSSTYMFNGQQVDMNAYKGTLDQLKSAFGGSVAPHKPEDVVLRLNDSGPDVVYLQQKLNAWGAKLTVDGSFGPATLSAVQNFQAAHGLSVDGVVGPATWSALDATPWNPSGWHYLAPTGLTARGGHTSVFLSWNAVTGTSPVFPAGQKAPAPASYTVRIFHRSGGAPITTRTAIGTSLQVGSLPKGALTAQVWANGGPVGPPNAQVNFTCA